MQEVYKAIGRVAATNVTVLIHGESGTGKELVARAIYQHSRRVPSSRSWPSTARPFPKSLLESELFGHEKGAFTGADQQADRQVRAVPRRHDLSRRDRRHVAAGPGEVLRVLQEQRFERVGGTETIQTDVRVIAATQRDLEMLIAEPAASARISIIGSMSSRSLCRRCAIAATTSDAAGRLLPGTLSPGVGKDQCPWCRRRRWQFLRRYRWPGNVRELQSTLKQGLLQMNGSVLLPEFLAAARKWGTPTAPAEAAPTTRPALDWDQFVTERLATGSRDLYAECLALMERQLLSRMLDRTAGNQLRASELLGITRGSLRHKLRALGLSIERNVSADDDRGE